MRNFIFGTILLNLIMSCKNSNDISETKLNKETTVEISKSNSKTETDFEILGDIYGSNKLILTGRFNECGEWGGHRENLIIHRKNNVLFANFIKDSVDCKNRPFDKNPRIVINETFELDKNKEKSVLEYLNKLLQARLKEQEIYHGYCIYSATNSDSTLILKYYHAGRKWSDFEKLKTELIK